MLTQNPQSAKFPQCPYCNIHHWIHCEGYQRKQNLFLWLCYALVVVMLFALPAHASIPTDSIPTIPTIPTAPPPTAPPITPYIVAGPVKIIDTNGIRVANSTFYIYCDKNDYDLYISIEAHFTNGGVTFMTDQYCGTEIYIEGDVELAKIVAVMAEPPSAVYRVWLPVVEG